MFSAFLFHFFVYLQELRIGDMEINKTIDLGALVTWTLKSAEETGKVIDGTYLVNEDFGITFSENSFIQGVVVYHEDGVAIVKVSDMSPDMFPFTLFFTELMNRFMVPEIDNENPYQRYLCLDVASMTSLYYYDLELGYMVDAVYDEEGNFEYYDLPEDNDHYYHLEQPEGVVPELVTIQLCQTELDELEEKEAFQRTDNLQIENAEGDYSFTDSHPCSINRAKTWFNTCDCAILTAWRSGMKRKINDNNNKNLHHRLQELGYGVTKITGWFPEKDKELARENSFLIVNLKSEDSFRDNIFLLSEKYDQDCFLYKKAGPDTPAVYVFTNDSYEKGSEKLLGRLRIGNMKAEAYSQIKAGRITFE